MEVLLSDVFDQLFVKLINGRFLRSPRLLLVIVNIITISELFIVLLGLRLIIIITRLTIFILILTFNFLLQVTYIEVFEHISGVI